MSESTGLLRIGELSRRSGVSPELLRAWERRYGLLEPTRSAGGRRLYAAADLDRVRSMQQHLAAGLAAAEAAAVPAGRDERAGEGLLVGVARQAHAGGAEGLVHEAGAVEPEIGLAAPQIRDPKEALRHRHEIFLSLRQWRKMPKRDEAHG